MSYCSKINANLKIKKEIGIANIILICQYDVWAVLHLPLGGQGHPGGHGGLSDPNFGHLLGQN